MVAPVAGAYQPGTVLERAEPEDIHVVRSTGERNQGRIASDDIGRGDPKGRMPAAIEIGSGEGVVAREPEDVHVLWVARNHYQTGNRLGLNWERQYRTTDARRHRNR